MCDNRRPLSIPRLEQPQDTSKVRTARHYITQDDISTSALSGLGDMIVSLSNGSLSLLRPDGTSGLAVTDTWHAHDYEPWIAAWDYWNPNVVFSGQCARTQRHGERPSDRVSR